MSFFGRLFGRSNTRPSPAAAPPTSSTEDRRAALSEFLNGFVYLITPHAPSRTVTTTAQAGTQLAISTLRDDHGRLVIPAFRSLEALQGSLTRPAGYVRLPTRALLEMSQQNPFDAIVVDGGVAGLGQATPPGFVLSPQDVSNLLSDLIPLGDRSVVVDRPVSRMIGHPAVPPPELLVSTVREFCDQASEISEAFIYWHAVGQMSPCYAVTLCIPNCTPARVDSIRTMARPWFEGLSVPPFDFSVGDEDQARQFRDLHIRAVYSRKG